MSRPDLLSFAAFAALLAAAAAGVAQTANAVTTQTAGERALKIGVLPSGPNDAITDVPGVRVGQVTKIEGSPGPLVPGKGPVRTGVTVVLPNDDPWEKRVAAATYDLNGNGEMTGAHWVNEAGFLEVPVALTNTLDVARVDDGVIDWLIARHPQIGVRDDVPLPVVAECDDQGLNDIQGRHVLASDAVAALDAAAPGPFARGAVGAGTGMRAYNFKAGIGTASRAVKTTSGTYIVGVLVNANTSSRENLTIEGVPVGREMASELLPSVPKGVSLRTRGRAGDGSIIIVIATDAPLDARQLHELAKRATLGLARTGSNSSISSGDEFIAFSTTNLYARDPEAPVAKTLVNDDDVMDRLFAATAEATEGAIVDALLSAKTTSGARGLTFYALPLERVKQILAKYGR